MRHGKVLLIPISLHDVICLHYGKIFWYVSSHLFLKTIAQYMKNPHLRWRN